MAEQPLMYRQGDVFLRAVPSIPADAQPVMRDAGRIILAYGKPVLALVEKGAGLLAGPGRGEVLMPCSSTSIFSGTVPRSSSTPTGSSSFRRSATSLRARIPSTSGSPSSAAMIISRQLSMPALISCTTSHRA